MSQLTPQLGYPVPAATIDAKRLADIQAVRQALLVLDGTIGGIIDALPTMNTSGNAGSATKLNTAREINGVPFDGTQNITIEANDPSALKTVAGNVPFGYARLDGNAKISSDQLPSYVDDILEYVDLAGFPATGESGKIYLAQDTNKIYRWSGSTYVDITSSGVETINGRRGLVTLYKSDVGLGNVDNTADLAKPVSLAQQALITETASDTLAAAMADATVKADAAKDASAPISHVGQGDAAHAVASETSHGFMSKQDKAKLNAITGINTGDQLDVTGNAGTATKLQTARNINGVPFDGTQDISVSAVDTATPRIPMSQKGVANGVATLDANGQVPANQLPSFVDDILEYANLAGFPGVGESGKIYVAMDTGKTYRWSGSVYVPVGSGAVEMVNGRTGIITLDKSDVGLADVDNTSDLNKPISNATAAALSALQSQLNAQVANIAHPFLFMGATNA